MELSGDHCSAESIELAEQTCEVSHRKQMLIVFCEGREYFAADAAKLVSRHSKLHLLRVDLSAEELLGPKRDEVAILWMDREAQMMKQIDGLLSLSD